MMASRLGRLLLLVGDTDYICSHNLFLPLKYFKINSEKRGYLGDYELDFSLAKCHCLLGARKLDKSFVC